MAPKKDTAKKEIASKQGDLREEKMKALESALAQLNKTYGKGAVRRRGGGRESAGDPYRLPGAGYGAGCGRSAPGPRGRNLRA